MVVALIFLGICFVMGCALLTDASRIKDKDEVITTQRKLIKELSGANKRLRRKVLEGANNVGKNPKDPAQNITGIPDGT